MKIAYFLILFLTLGLALAKDFFASLGYEATYLMIAAFGLALATQLMFRSSVTILSVVLLVLMVSLPQTWLEEHGLDHEILLALVLAIIVYPWIRKFSSE